MGLLYFGIPDESLLENASWISLIVILPLTLWYGARLSLVNKSYLHRILFFVGLVAHVIEIIKRIASGVSHVDIAIAVLFGIAYSFVWFCIFYRRVATDIPVID